MTISGRRLAVAALLVPFLLAGSAVPSLAASARRAEAAGCPGQAAPPGPPAPEELPPVPPLPVPDPPVSGLAACADAHAGPVAPPPVGVASYLVADLDSGRVLATRAPHARHRPASTIKLLLALVVTERLPPERVVVATAEDANVEGSRAGIGPGGRYTVEQLLQGLLLASGNDCAAALSRALGGVGATLAAMQDTARRLGALDTRPATPSGLDGPGMSASAHDLALIYREALTRPRIATVLTLPSVGFPGFGARPGFELGNDDPLLGTPGFLGGKSGFTDAARHTFVGGIERGGRRLVVALVRGEMRPVPMADQARALLDWGFTVPASAPALGTLVTPGTPRSGPAPAPAPAGTGTTAPLRTDPAGADPAGADPAGTDAGSGPGVPGPAAAGIAAGIAAVAALALAAALRRRHRRR